jgi:NAD(P)-dependent dehydrogenase (short-subunit alcohol dehydrogenase family)
METDNGKRAVVTGAGRGIGAAAAGILAAAGWEVVALVRDVASAEERFASAPGVRVMRADVGDAVALAAVAAEIDGAVDLLVANAAQFSPWDETVLGADIPAVEAVIDTNVLGTWRTVQAFAPLLRRRAGGAIIVVGSGAGSHGDPRFGVGTSPGAAGYAVSKAAVHVLTRKLASELAGEVAVYAVDPGLTATAPGMADFGARPVREGAQSVLFPVLHPGFVVPGTLTRDGGSLPW